SRGFILALAGGGDLSVTPRSKLTDEDRQTLKAHKDSLVWQLKHPAGEPDPFITSETCSVCGAELLPDNGKRFRKVRCPAGCISGWHPPSNQPHINEQGDLVIPLNCKPRIRHWSGGQSVVETLAELNAPLETWRWSAARLTGNHSETCTGEIRQSGEVV